MANDSLRPLAESDLEAVRGWRNHPGVNRHLYTQHRISAEEHAAWFERLEKDPSRHAFVFLGNGEAMGFVQFRVVDALARRAEWGFYLAPHAPRGSGRRLGRLALTEAFDVLGMHKVCGEALAANHASIRMHRRLGFVHEATLRDHFFDGENYHDVHGFGLLAREWDRREQGE